MSNGLGALGRPLRTIGSFWPKADVVTWLIATEGTANVGSVAFHARPACTRLDSPPPR